MAPGGVLEQQGFAARGSCREVHEEGRQDLRRGADRVPHLGRQREANAVHHRNRGAGDHPAVPEEWWWRRDRRTLTPEGRGTGGDRWQDGLARRVSGGGWVRRLTICVSRRVALVVVASRGMWAPRLHAQDPTPAAQPQTPAAGQ